MRILTKLLTALGLGLLLAGSLVAAEQRPLTLGVFPYVSPGKLIAHQQGLQQFLQDGLGRQVNMVTAPDVASYMQRLRAGDYDLIFAAPHVGRYSETDAGYQRIATTDHTVQAVFLTRKESPVQQLSDLEGRSIAMGIKTSIVYQMCEEQLRQLGLVSGRNIDIRESSSHNNAIFALIKGETDAAVTGIKLWQSLPSEHRQKLRQIGETQPVPGFMLMANRDMPATTVSRLQQLALAFKDSAAGKKYLFRGLKPIDDAAMRSMDPYTAVFR